jgi:hypothetical protein
LRIANHLLYIESIYTDGTAIKLYIIIQGKKHIESWYKDRDLDQGEIICTSDSGFTNDKIVLQWLRHFKKEIRREVMPEDSTTLPWKLLLLDGYGSHTTEEFTLLANAHRIICWTFLPNLTYIMQLYNVGIFSTWKHWHQWAITESVGTLDIEYNLQHFLGNVPTIREKTFKERTVKHTFSKAGI